MGASSQVLTYQKLKSSIDLRSFVTGEEYANSDPVMWRCFWHNDGGRENLAIYPTHFFCHRCGARKDIHDYLVATKPNRWRLVDTIQELQNWRGPTPPDEPEEVPLDPIPYPLAYKYHAALLENDGAIDRLFKRGINEETIRSNLIGHNGFAFVIPVFDDEHSSILTLRFRRDDGVLKEGTKYWGMRNRNKVLLFNAHLLHSERSVILCEGEFDALLATQSGFPTVTFTNGKQAYTDKYDDLFSLLDTLYLCFDMDEASCTRARALAPTMHELVPDVRLVSWPLRKGKDISEFIVSEGVSAFAERLRKAVKYKKR